MIALFAVGNLDFQGKSQWSDTGGCWVFVHRCPRIFKTYETFVGGPARMQVCGEVVHLQSSRRYEATNSSASWIEHVVSTAAGSLSYVPGSEE